MADMEVSLDHISKQSMRINPHYPNSSEFSAERTTIKYLQVFLVELTLLLLSDPAEGFAADHFHGGGVHHHSRLPVLAIAPGVPQRILLLAIQHAAHLMNGKITKGVRFVCSIQSVTVFK